MYGGRSVIFSDSSNNLSGDVERHAPDRWLYPGNEATMGCVGFIVGATGAGVHTHPAVQSSAEKVSATAKSAAQSVPAGVSAPLEHLPTWSLTSAS